MKKQIKWDWYGSWVIDWLTSDPLSGDHWEDFGIWAKAYREANPELSEVSNLELIESHYTEAMEPLFSSWVFFIWWLLKGPMYCVHWLVWQIKQKFF
jgi:hypothetical protein